MAITKNKLLSDLTLSLNQSDLSDDSPIELSQLAYWASNTLNDLVRKEIYGEMKNGNGIPPIYIKHADGLELSEETVVDIDDDKQRIFTELEEDVLDLPKDAGIVLIQDYDRNQIYSSSVENNNLLNKMRFAKATSDNKIYYRQGKKIFIEGFKTADLEFNPISVSYVPKQDLLTMDDTDEVLISDQLVTVLSNLLVAQGKRMLYGSKSDDNSDGADNKPQFYHLGIQDPNQPENNAT